MTFVPGSPPACPVVLEAVEAAAEAVQKPSQSSIANTTVIVDDEVMKNRLLLLTGQVQQLHNASFRSTRKHFFKILRLYHSPLLLLLLLRFDPFLDSSCTCM
jgi:hypothetical protein